MGRVCISQHHLLQLSILTPLLLPQHFCTKEEKSPRVCVTETGACHGPGGHWGCTLSQIAGGSLVRRQCLLLPASHQGQAQSSAGGHISLPCSDSTYRRRWSVAFILNPIEISPNWLRKDCVHQQLRLGVGRERRGEEAGGCPSLGTTVASEAAAPAPESSGQSQVPIVCLQTQAAP